MIIDKVLIIVSAIIKNEKDKVLLLQRSKKSSYPGHWQLVEGKLKEDELPLGALEREVKEETGVKVSQIKMNTVTYNEIEAKGLKYLCFRIVFDAKVVSSKIKTSDEHISFGWFNKDEAIKLPLLPGTENILDKLL